jgi:hypothetical protein
MSRKDYSTAVRFAALVATAILAGTPVIVMAQPAGQQMPMMGQGPDASFGGGMPNRHGSMCGPRLAGLMAEHLAWIEETADPTNAQRPSFEALKAAAERARQIMRAACMPPRPGATVPERLGMIQARLEAALQAVGIVRPAFDAFYGTLDDSQKSRLDAGSRWMHGAAGWP